MLAGLAQGRLRAKTEDLLGALQGRFSDHHAVMLRFHLDHIDHLDATISRLDDQIDGLMGPFEQARGLLCTIPGVAKRTAEVIIAETGADMSRFPTPGHLASWAGLCPGNNESAGKHRTGKTRTGDIWLTDTSPKPPGRPPEPKTATSKPATGNSPAGSANTKPPPPSPTTSSPSAGTSSPPNSPTTTSDQNGPDDKTTPPDAPDN